MILVYKYGLKPPTAHTDDIWMQMRAAHRYYNDLIAIARGLRAAQRDVIQRDEGVRAATMLACLARDRVIAAHDAVRAERIELRERNQSHAADHELREARTAYRATLKALDKAHRAAERTPVVRAEFDRMAELADGVRVEGERNRHGGIRKACRAQCGVWWGTYALVEARVDQALKLIYAPGKSKTLPRWDGLEPRDPHFARWRESTPAVGAYNNAGATGSSADFMGFDGRVLKMKITGNTWAEWPVRADRPLPPDARITSCKVTAAREGFTPQWEAHITLETHAERKRHDGSLDTHGIGRVAVDIGWRVIGDQLRVAAWRDQDGNGEDLRLPAELISQLRHARGLRGARDELFNQARLALAWWITLNGMPDWMSALILKHAGEHTEETDAEKKDTEAARALRSLFRWKSQDRLMQLVVAWRDKRFDGDEEIHRVLDDWTPGSYTAVAWRGHAESWRRRDKHLVAYEAGQRNRALRRRDDLYRQFAAWLSRRYDTVVLEKFDLRDVAELPDVASTEPDEQASLARSQRQLAAVSVLRLAIKHAFTSRGGSVIEVESAQSTHECPACHEETEFDAAQRIEWECAHCGHQWDQDHSAAVILRERSCDAGTVTARTGGKQAAREKKWERIKREKRERTAAMTAPSAE